MTNFGARTFFNSICISLFLPLLLYWLTIPNEFNPTIKGAIPLFLALGYIILALKKIPRFLFKKAVEYGISTESIKNAFYLPSSAFVAVPLIDFGGDAGAVVGFSIFLIGMMIYLKTYIKLINIE